MNTTTTTVTDTAAKKADTPPAKKKRPSMLETISSLRMRNRHALWICAWALVTITLMALIAIFFVDRGNGNGDMTQALITKLDRVENAIRDEGDLTRTVINNVGVTVEKSSRANVETLSKVVENVNAKLEAEGLKTAQTLTALQIATTAGLTGVTDEVKKSSDGIKASADKFDATLMETRDEITKLRAELALLKVNPTAPAVEASIPVTAVTPVATPTDSLSLATVPDGAPRAQARSLEKSAPIETSVWKKIPAGTITDTYCCDAVRQRKIEVEEGITGLIVLSYRGWPKRLIGQYPVGDTVPIAHGATSVAFMHPTKSFNIKVNK